MPVDKMNRTERAYADLLETRRRAGDLAWYAFDRISLRLGDGCHYRPDFLVMLADGKLEVHEVKGFWRDDARVKIKVAAAQFPFRFIAVQKRAKKHGGGWKINI